MGHLLAVRTGGWGSASCLGLVQSARSRLGRGPVTGLPGLGAGALKEALGVSCRRAPWFYLQFAGGGEKVRQCAGRNRQKGRERSCCWMTGERGVSPPRGQTASLAPREMQRAADRREPRVSLSSPGKPARGWGGESGHIAVNFCCQDLRGETMGR